MEKNDLSEETNYLSEKRMIHISQKNASQLNENVS